MAVLSSFKCRLNFPLGPYYSILQRDPYQSKQISNLLIYICFMKRRYKGFNLCKFQCCRLHDFWSNCEAVKMLVGSYSTRTAYTSYTFARLSSKDILLCIFRSTQRHRQCCHRWSLSSQRWPSRCQHPNPIFSLWRWLLHLLQHSCLQLKIVTFIEI